MFILPKKISVFVSLECIEEYFKNIFVIPSHFRHKIELLIISFHVHAQQKCPGVGKSGSRTGCDVTSGMRLLSPPVYFNVSLYFHTNSIIFRIIYAKKWLILYGKTMKHWNEESTIPEVTSRPVLDPDLATPGHLFRAWPAREL